MMFGGDESFGYFQCSECSCLQITEQPADMARYYSGNYYSHQNSKGFRGYIEGIRDRYSLTGRGLVGKMLDAVFPNQAMKSLHSLKIARDARILDVGCGSGALLFGLQACGFRYLVGADPFSNPVSGNGVEIRNQEIGEMEGVFDLVMFHHSFEHVWEPLDNLNHAARLLKDGGQCIIRIPVVPCQAWEKYGVNWVQIDAPRHFFIHSPDSIKLLAEQAGFEVKEVVYDSTALQFWGSEQYLKGVALQDDRSFFVSPARSEFSVMQILKFAKEARRLNAEGRGDQAAFYLVKKGGEA
jgi:SAM-dependent methyltransferase